MKHLNLIIVIKKILLNNIHRIILCRSFIAKNKRILKIITKIIKKSTSHPYHKQTIIKIFLISNYIQNMENTHNSPQWLKDLARDTLKDK